MTKNQPVEVGEKKRPSLDLVAIREKLANMKGRQYWRSLDELAETPEFQRHVQDEFPQWADRLVNPVSRRNFLKFMGASMAMVGLSGCTVNSILHPQPIEQIAPYTKQPEQVVSGKPLYFATAMSFGGFGIGLLAESHLGRPIKVEGNPDHPASLGATDAFAQADILTLYDPERSQAIKRVGRISDWDVFVQSVGAVLDAKRANGGKGLRILTQTITSPTLVSQLDALLGDMPEAKWYQYEPVNRDNVYEGAMLAFGEPVEIQYHFDKAKVVLSLDSDVLISGPGSVRYARDFADQRRVLDDTHEMSRLYAVESMPTGTGSVSDNRLPLPASHIELFARQIAQGLGVSVETGSHVDEEHTAWMEAVVADLQEHAGECLIVAGDSQPPAVHALAHAMNQRLGNIGSTVTYTDPVVANPMNQVEALRELVTEMEAGDVDLLIMLDGNPVFDAPVDLEFSKHLENVQLRIHFGLYENETSALSHWHIPATHYLEMWGDVRAYDGTVTVVQPLIAPLYDGHSIYEFVAFLQGGQKLGYDIVSEYWKNEAVDDKKWKATIHDGVMADSAYTEKSVTPNMNLGLPAPEVSEGLELNFRPDPTIWDGRYANNGWLQELPKPFTNLTWDNAALVSPTLAKEYELENGDLVSLEYDGRSMKAPIWILAGHAKNSVTIGFGYGRTHVGKVGEGTGFDAYTIRTSGSSWFATGVKLRKLNKHYQLATTQNHHSMHGRDIIRFGTLEEFLHPHEEHGHHEYLSLQPEYPYNGYAWGMAVDLTNCTGCNACVTACNAENNVAIVGKNEVVVGREMHWIRIDRYFAGDLDNPISLSQPLMCHHCEHAPCEIVCPVAATVHSAEGLNDMVYNRCVGTRFCANNCPYKVRRFNFYQYQETEIPVVELRYNPDVTVRSRGVIEKCSYCVQRINDARIEAKKIDSSKIKDGELQTACQQACPTRAIVFGDINDHDSEVYKMKQLSRNYGLLAELNTKPRTTYLKRINNPNPAFSHDEHGEG
jgi:molybdopterin-containing oxidoreductase family iron-sulfur binding subunit